MTTITQNRPISPTVVQMISNNNGATVRDQKLLRMIGGLYGTLIILCTIIPFAI